VVFLGATARGADETDVRVTPLGAMPRVEITANAVASVLSRSYLVRSRGNDIVAILIVAGIIAGLLLPQARPGRVVLAGIGLVLLYGAVAWGLLTFRQILLPLLPVTGALGAATLVALAISLAVAAQERRHLAL